MTINLKICLDEGVEMPQRKTEGSAAFDIAASKEVWVYKHGEGTHASTRVHTGIYLEIPKGYAGFLIERSSNHTRGLTLANNVGLIDSDYRGELTVALTSIVDHEIKVLKGQRIAQLVIMPLAEINLIQVEDLNETIRGCGSFGSTGT